MNYKVIVKEKNKTATHIITLNNGILKTVKGENFKYDTITKKAVKTFYYLNTKKELQLKIDNMTITVTKEH